MIELQRPPPGYEHSYMQGQTTELEEVVQERIASVPAQRDRQYIREATQIEYMMFRRIATGNIIDVQDFLVCNIIAALCFNWPIGLLGIRFSMLCRLAKLEGKRKQAKCYSVVAGVMFALSVIGVITLIIVFLSLVLPKYV